VQAYWPSWPPLSKVRAEAARVLLVSISIFGVAVLALIDARTRLW
jgi:hypothetical protein